MRGKMQRKWPFELFEVAKAIELAEIREALQEIVMLFHLKHMEAMHPGMEDRYYLKEAKLWRSELFE